jgi:hypothetical protein
MRRGMSNVVSALSGALCLLVGVIWIWSYRAQLSFEFERHGNLWEMTLSAGRLSLTNAPQSRLEWAEWRALHRTLEAMLPQVEALADAPRSVEMRELEQTITTAGRFTANAKRMFLPSLVEERWSFRLSQAAFATVLLPLAWLQVAIAAKRRRAALVAGRACSACGYDLRATPDRCPECGTDAPPALRGHLAGTRGHPSIPPAAEPCSNPTSGATSETAGEPAQGSPRVRAVTSSVITPGFAAPSAGASQRSTAR